MKYVIEIASQRPKAKSPIVNRSRRSNDASRCNLPMKKVGRDKILINANGIQTDCVRNGVPIRNDVRLDQKNFFSLLTILH